MVHDGPFLEIALILGLATALAMVGQKLRQPLLIMFLTTGILAGPSVLGIVQSYEQIDLLAHIGIALLLFIVGLKLDLHLIRTTGPVALATGLGQIIFTSVIGFGIALALGLDLLNAAYLAVALTFSSTIIIVKLLSDKKEIDSLHGQIALGFLIVQDIAAIIALVTLTTIGSASAESDGSLLIAALTMAGKGIGLLLGIGLLMRYVIPHLVQRLAHSLELLTLFAVAWAVLLAALSDQMGFSKEVGAFLAGISLASTAYRDAIGARLTSLRDFLLLFFFIDLGARLDWSMVGAQIPSALILSAFVLIGNPIVVLIIMGIMGYRRRTGFLAGLTVAQISEFSLIVAALGLALGHISPETMGLVTLVGVATIFLSTYMILYSGPLYRLLANVLRIFERHHPFREAAEDQVGSVETIDVIVVGLGNYGQGLVEDLLRRGKTLLGVDFDPVALTRWRKRGIAVLYGDVADPDMHEQLPLQRCRWVVSTVRSRALNMALIQGLVAQGYTGRVALTASDNEEAETYQTNGAHLVLRPFADATEQAADALTYAMDYLPTAVNWPIAFLEVRIRSDAAIAGQAIRDIPLRSVAGVSVLAVSRGGRLDYDPAPQTQVFPGDRLLIMGPANGLKEAEKILHQHAAATAPDDGDRFDIAEIAVADDSPMAGHSLADLQFRQRYGVTLIGIRRGQDQITTINPADPVMAGDRLIVIGASHAIASLRKQVPMTSDPDQSDDQEG